MRAGRHRRRVRHRHRAAGGGGVRRDGRPVGHRLRPHLRRPGRRADHRAERAHGAAVAGGAAAARGAHARADVRPGAAGAAQAHPPAAVGGLVIWSVYVGLRWLGWPAVLATAVAAAAIGLLGSVYADRVRVPPMVFVIPAIGPLLPGSALFRGMLKLNLGDVTGGTHYLIEALSAALAIGAGVILGMNVLRALGGRGPGRRTRRS
ncbi:threonine/serine exporter family protein [Nonomuraea thailandensis]